ncbi:GatB/YqeY domain-containing protein [Serpentinimonas barnesii]|uniref:GatB/YqeY domain-containing protein n=1 Tax=Serpentinimonas barnesii TaxID=1458427 RepID=UPI000497E524|nr:GatB/YqeY domain-containing protein [Serpentinimonas barnesii]
MSLKDRISDDMKAAMRAKDSARLGTIRLLLAAIKQREVDERIVLDDGAVVGVIDKLLKQRKDSITAFQQAGRTDLADLEQAEALVLQAYLPERLSAAAVASAVEALAQALTAELGRPLTPADMGRLMAAAKTQLAGQADMGQVSAAVKAALAR